MTVSSSVAKSGPYAGAGTTGPFTVGFRFLENSHLRVVRTDVNGNDATLILDADYSVTGAGGASGTVTTVIALAVGEKLTIVRSVPATQESDYVQNDAFPAESHETALDKLTMLVQQNGEAIDRSIKVGVADAPLADLPGPTARANTVIGFDALGNVTTLPLPSTLGAGDRIPFTLVAGVDFTAGVSTTVTLPRAPGAPGNLEIFFDPLFQGFDQWNVSDLTVTFTSPIPVGVAKIFGYIGTTLSTLIPPDGSVDGDTIVWNGILNRVVTTLTALKALDVSRYTNAYMMGRATPGDGADGFWRYDGTSVATVNDGTVVQPTAGPGRWLRQYAPDTVKACWFGAGMGALDDTAAITAALATLPSGGTLDFEGRAYKLIPSTVVAYNDKFSVARKTAVQITGRSNIALLFKAGSSIVVNGTDSERVAFFLKNCSGVTVHGAYFPNASGLTSIAGGTYLPSEDYYPFAFEGNNGLYLHDIRTEACRSALMADAFNGAPNKNIVIDRLFTYQTCNYSLITRNADNIQVRNARLEQTGRSWNTSNEDIAFSDNSTNCKAVNCDALQPIGRVSRFGTVNNVGPTVFENCRLTGEGIWIEINQGSNLQVIGGYSKRGTGERISEHILFTSDVFTGNSNVTVTGAQFFGGGVIVADYYPLGWGAADIDGFVMTGCTAQDTYGVQLSLNRQGVVFADNRFNLNSGGILVRPGGTGTAFTGNSVKNGYVRVDGDNFKAVGNHMHGNPSAPIAFTWDVQGCVGFVERDNTYTAGGFTQYFNHAPGARFGTTHLQVGHDQNPQFSLASYITGVVGDFVRNSAPLDGTPQGWTCTVAGSPGTWAVVGQNGLRTGTVAPSVNANFIGEEFLDTVANKFYKAKNTGTGSSDWVALN